MCLLRIRRRLFARQRAQIGCHGDIRFVTNAPQHRIRLYDGQFDVLKGVYEPSGGVIGKDTDIGITSAATSAYKQIERRGLLKPDTSVTLPLVSGDIFFLVDEGASQIPCERQIAA